MLFRRSVVVLVALMSCASLKAAKSAAKDAGVTSLVEDFAANIAPILQIQSDQKGTYTNSGNVSSITQGGGGNWVLDTTASTRTVYLSFAKPVTGSGPGGSTPSFESGYYPVRILTECPASASGFTFLTLPGSGTTACGLHVGITMTNGAKYGIEMDPNGPNGPFVRANVATVTCVTPTSGSPCTTWSVSPSQAVAQPNGSVIYQSDGAFLSYSTVKGRTVATYLGDFLFSFEFIVQN